MTKEHQDETTRIKNSYDGKLKDSQNERDEYKNLYEQVKKEFEDYKTEQNIRDLLVVKFDIPEQRPCRH